MKLLFMTCLLFAVAIGARAAEPPLAVHNFARDFVVFWDATEQMPAAERIAAFKQQIGTKFPEFYGIERYNGRRTQEQQDERIGRILAGFGPARAAYLATVVKFDTDLPRYIETFTRAFPDFRLQTPTYFLHSLNEMDGGTRDLNGRNYLIFGADMMASVHGAGDESAFFHHELFHTYQGSCDGPGIWQRLWREGLAVHVSKVLNAQANDKEMLLDFPPGSVAVTKSRLHEALLQLEGGLDNGSSELSDALFSGGKDNTDLPRRRGYYLGYLVAQDIGKTRDLPTLAKLSCGDAHELIRASVQKLRQQAEAAPK